MKLTPKDFEKLFPHLSKELQTQQGVHSMDAIHADSETTDAAATATAPATASAPGDAAAPPLRGYAPDVVAFLRRCDHDEEGEEIITFLETRGEITSAYAADLRRQLRAEGIRSFGPKKAADHYLQQQGP